MSIDEFSMTRRVEEENTAGQPSNDKESYDPQKIDINRYKDPAGMTVSRLDMGYWLLSNKQKTIEMIYFAFLLFGVFSWLFFFFQFGAYVIKGMQQERLFAKFILFQNTPDFSYFATNKVKDLEYLPMRVLPGNANTKDIVAQVKNPNPNHWARFDYHFLSSGQKIAEKEGFILPGQEKLLVEIGQDSNVIGNSVKLVIDDINWARVNPHDFGKWEKFESRHLNFSFEDIEFIEARESQISDRLSLNVLSFKAENKSDYNYWNVPLIISLYSYGDMVSVAKYDINDFESRQEREVSFTWPGDLPRISEVRIEPDLDVTRLDIYKDFKAPTGNFR